MSEYWLISAPGDKTCQQTFDTMNQATRNNNLCENYKFHIPDLKVGTLDQLVGLSDDLGKLDGFVEQTTRKIANYLGDVLEDQRDKLFENLVANNSIPDTPEGLSTPSTPPESATSTDGNRYSSSREEMGGLSLTDPVYRAAAVSGKHSCDDGTSGSSRHGSLTNSSSSACFPERATVCSCPIPSAPSSPSTVSGGHHSGKSKLRGSRKKAPSGRARNRSSTNQLEPESGLPSPRSPDLVGGHSAPETDHEQGSGFEWRWFHRRKHSHKSRSRSSSHLSGGSGDDCVGDHGHHFATGSPVTSCCGGGLRGPGRRHDHSLSSDQDEAEADEVYGGRNAAGRNGLHPLALPSSVGVTNSWPAQRQHSSHPPQPTAINPADLTSYIIRFQWDLAKYPTKQSLRNIADIISKQVGQIDADLKTKSAAYNNLKGNLQNLEKKQSGSLLTRNLADLVKKEHFILDSEYLTTLLVIVPKANMNDWNAHYEKITDMIVPRSSQTITQDSDYALCSVTLFKKVVDEFKLHARERKFVVREFVYNEEELAAGKNEITKLVTDKKKQFGPLVRWLKVNFSECFCAWVHVKALRVFVESVLRYGLPVNFQAILIHPNKKSTKRLRDVLQQLYGHLDGSAGSSGGNADNVDIPGLGFGQSEYFPYVYYKLNVDMVDTKV